MPPSGFTVIEPSEFIVHPAGPPVGAFIHLDKLVPSNNIIASLGGIPFDPETTTSGIGSQTSVNFGSIFF